MIQHIFKELLMDFELKIPARVVSGRGCVEKNSGLFRQFGSKCFIVTGGRSAKLSGALADAENALETVGIDFEVFDRITANPLISSCHEGGRLARQFDADFILGIGGGSPLDAAKAVAVYAANPDLGPADIYRTDKRNKPLTIVAIGTTAGTGSEIGRVSVLTNDETGRKKSISGDELTPALTFADPKYTDSMPFSVTCSTALDALCHALEGYFSVKCGDIPTMFAEKAVSLIYGGLKELFGTMTVPTADKRDALYYGSLYAGITLAYCGTGFPHPLGYVLTENYGVPHGFACAAFLPEFMSRAAGFEKEKFSRIMSVIGESPEDFDALVSKLTVLPDIRMTEEEIAAHCSRWDEAVPANFRFSPGGFTKSDAEALFKKLFGEG